MKRLELFLASTLGAVLATVLYISVRPAEAAYIPIPAGAILYFDRTTATGCPTGWTEFTNARGAYIVGLTNGGTKNTLVGTALSNQENRPTGVHNHSVTDTHTHSNGFNGGAGDRLVQTGTTGTAGQPASTGGTNAGAITVNNSSGVAGTNAPYIQLLVCSKS